MDQWVHVTFTWCVENQAGLYAGIALQSRGNATELNNGYGRPMTLILRSYHERVNCTANHELTNLLVH